VAPRRDRVTLAYAPRGLLGVLTPQANTTVEPELGILAPAGVGVMAARLTSDDPSMDRRLLDYFEGMDRTIAQFADMPLAAVGFACTGASYLAGPAREDAAVGALSARLGYPVVTSALAIVAALGALRARRIGLVTPYPEALTRASVGYWEARGLAVGPVARVADHAGVGQPPAGAAPAGHPIYSMTADAASRALDAIDSSGVDAIVMLGTGLPTLGALLAARGARAPAMSCNLALAWACAEPIERHGGSADSLLRWISGEGWRARFEARHGAGAPA
jgi:maleate isomerase